MIQTFTTIKPFEKNENIYNSKAFSFETQCQPKIIFKSSIHIKAQNVYTFLLLMKNAPKTEEKSWQRAELRLLASE